VVYRMTPGRICALPSMGSTHAHFEEGALRIESSFIRVPRHSDPEEAARVSFKNARLISFPSVMSFPSTLANVRSNTQKTTPLRRSIAQW